VGAAGLAGAPRFPLHPFDLLAGRVIVVAGSPRYVGFFGASPSGWIWRRVVEIAGSGSSCVTAMHAFFCSRPRSLSFRLG
jgi:hypothetical protein